MPPPVLPSPRAPKEQLLALFAMVSGVQVAWWTARRPLQGLKPLNEKAWVLIGIQSWVGVGVDELRTRWNETTQQNEQLLVGQRQFTVVVSARSLDASLEAVDLCERVRFRLRTQAARALMIPKLALRDIQPTTTLPDAIVEGRTLLAASMDVRMACVVAEDPMDPGEGDWIGTATPGPGTLLP